MRKLLLLLCLIAATPVVAALPKAPFVVGRGIHAVDATRPPLSAGEHYQAGIEAVSARDWEGAILNFECVCRGYRDSEYVDEALYQLGEAYFNVGQYSRASVAFADYLKRESSPRNFEKVFEYKYAIAEYYRSGGRREFLGRKGMPKLFTSKQEALDLYEEIYTSIPSHELAAKSLYSRGRLHLKMKDYTVAIDRFQSLLTRFPKNPLAPESYLSIAQCYLEEAKHQAHNPDLLALAQINVRKFRQDFPTDERLIAAEGTIAQMKEIFAHGLFETGKFYEKTRKPKSAAVYYANVMQEFPSTQAALSSRQRLEELRTTAVQ